MSRTHSFICALCVFAVGATLAQDRKLPKPRVTVGEIQSAEILGSLGVPLGSCVPIRATIARSDSNTKASEGRFYLKVSHVNDRPLSKPFMADFGVHRFAANKPRIARDDFELYKLAGVRKMTI